MAIARDPAQTEFVEVALAETLGSGVTGKAVLSRNGDQTDVVITVTRIEFSAQFPYVAHLHRGLNCDQTKMDETEVLSQVDIDGRSESTVNHNLNEILDGGWLVNVHGQDNQTGTDLACGYIPPTYSGEDVGLSAMKDRVSVRSPGGEGKVLAPNTLRAVTNDDTISVDATGEAWLRFLDSLLVRIFRDSDLVSCLDGIRQEGLVLCPEVSPGAPDERVVSLRDGGIAVYATERIAVQSGNAVIRTTGTHFLVEYDQGRRLTWVVVTKGAVAVTAAGATVTVDAGWQTQVDGNSPPRNPQPATRPNLESRYPGVFPLLQYSTNWALRDDEVLGVAPVTPSPTVTGPTVTVPPAIDQPPSPPACISAEPQGKDVLLSWCAATDDDRIAEYRIVRDGNYLATVDGSQTSYTDTATEECTIYSYYVIAVDTAGQESKSETTEIQTGAVAQGHPGLVYADLVSEINRQDECT